VAAVTILQMPGGGTRRNPAQITLRSRLEQKAVRHRGGVAAVDCLSRPKLHDASSYDIVFPFSGQRIAKRTGRPPMRKMQIRVGQACDRIRWTARDFLPFVWVGVDYAGAPPLGAHQSAHQ
jgi:hypothetical protein